jgi:hypothetical protein
MALFWACIGFFTFQAMIMPGMANTPSSCGRMAEGRYHCQLIARCGDLNQQAALDHAVHHRAAGSDWQMLRRNRQQLRMLRAMAQYNPLRV